MGVHMETKKKLIKYIRISSLLSLSLSLFDQVQLKWYVCSVELRRAILQDLVIWVWLELDLYLQSSTLMASESVTDKWAIQYDH